jgi:hypothetical protein
MKSKTQGRMDQSSGEQESLGDRLKTAALAKQLRIEAIKQQATARKAAASATASPKGAKKPR